MRSVTRRVGRNVFDLICLMGVGVISVTLFIAMAVFRKVPQDE